LLVAYAALVGVSGVAWMGRDGAIDWGREAERERRLGSTPYAVRFPDIAGRG
jgi:hypothetical protein